MKYKFTIFLVLFFLNLYGQNDVKLYGEKAVDGGFIIYADNKEPCMVSAQLTYTVLENLSLTDEKNKIYLIPPDSSKHIVTKLEIKDIAKGTKYNYNYQIRYGNAMSRSYDKEYAYYLPFEKNKSFRVSQAYFGAISHQNTKAIDFSLPIGTKIHAARGGVVVDVLDTNRKRCDKIECMKFNNYIRVYHSDGSIGAYLHLKYKSALVKKGDSISRGQLIALSGNVGYTTGPHLHFEVYKQNMIEIQTLTTKFLLKENKPPKTLKEGGYYKRKYD